MTTFEKLRAGIFRQNKLIEQLERELGAAKDERRKCVEQLQETCPHHAAAEIKGEDKYPGEKTFSVHYRICLDCELQETMYSLNKLASPRSIYRVKYSDRHTVEILGRKLR